MRKREIEDVKMNIAFAEYKFWSQLHTIFKGELYIKRIYVYVCQKMK